MPPALPPASFLSPSALQVKEVGDTAAGPERPPRAAGVSSASAGVSAPAPGGTCHPHVTRGAPRARSHRQQRPETEWKSDPCCKSGFFSTPHTPFPWQPAPSLTPFPSHCSPHRSLPTGRRARPGGHHTSRSESVLPLPGPPKTAPAPAQHRPRCGAAPVGRSRQQGLWAQRPILGGAQRATENVKGLLSSPTEKQTLPRLGSRCWRPPGKDLTSRSEPVWLPAST